jgi:signal peptidase I
MSEPPRTTDRKPWLAVALSLFATGLGQIYCGRLVTGLVLFLMSLLVAPVAVAAALLGFSTPVMIGLMLAILAVLGAYLYSVVNAYMLARQTPGPYELREYNRPLVYTLFILVAVTYPVLAVTQIRANVFAAFFIPTAGMSPNILQGDHLLVNKMTFRLRAPERGDVVVFRTPKDRRLTWVKRVIALSGDTVELKNNEVFVNDRKLERDPVPASSLTALGVQVPGKVFSETNAGRRYRIMLGPEPLKTANFPRTTVPEGTCFVLGDGRDDSTDSRDSSVGFVPLGDILGSPQFIYWPAESWSRFGAYRD